MVQQFQQAPQPAGRSRVKGEHRYPIYDLDGSIGVARAIRDKGGGSSDLPHLAGFLGYSSTNNGAFITRIAAARLFGLIEKRDRFLVLTPLANAIIAPEHPGRDDASARYQAFMSVPFYRSLYERYKDTKLPPDMGLRNTMEAHYGIPRARTQLAHRVLMDSAGQAGLYDARGGARTHFVAPLIPDDAEEGAMQWAQDLSQDETEIRGQLSQPSPEMQAQATQVDPMRRLQQILVEKVREVPATDLDTIREYIKEIEKLGERKEDEKPE